MHVWNQTMCGMQYENKYLGAFLLQPELNANVMLTERKERRKIKEPSPARMEKVLLKGHKFEKIPAQENVRKYNVRLLKPIRIIYAMLQNILIL